MTMITDLSQDLIEEILFRVPITSKGKVRATCKDWNVLSNDQYFIEKHCEKLAAKELLVIMVDYSSACLMNVNLHNHTESPIKEKGNFSSQLEVSQVFHCDGLLLCYQNDMLMVWNPYLGQVRWIQTINKFYTFCWYAMGYDNNHNHKIFRSGYGYGEGHRTVEYEIYDFKSNSWKVLEDTPDRRFMKYYPRQPISLKGNTYFIAKGILEVDMGEFLLCFDFTSERFGPRLHLPFDPCCEDHVSLSTIRDERLAVLFRRRDCATNVTQIWITTKIDPDEVLWRSFLKVDMKPSTGRFCFQGGTFLVDEKKKVAVIFRNDGRCKKAYLIGEEGSYKEVDLGKSTGLLHGCSYVPSSVRIQ